jgi:hypothetical protein
MLQKIKKSRIKVSKAIHDKVLKEFNYKCSICGKTQPQIHHIDENPSNNDIMNLLPLCPNCHINDQHNPTTHIPINKLELFRKYKDPAILSSKFSPLYKRLSFLFEISSKSSMEVLKKLSEDLLNFVSVLNMGVYYKDELGKLVTPSTEFTDGGPLFTTKKITEEYIQQLINNREKIFEYIVELLCYQDWLEKKNQQTIINES